MRRFVDTSPINNLQATRLHLVHHLPDGRAFHRLDLGVRCLQWCGTGVKGRSACEGTERA